MYKIKFITKNVYKIKNNLQSESTTTPDTNVKASLISVSGNFSAPWFYVIQQFVLLHIILPFIKCLKNKSFKK